MFILKLQTISAFSHVICIRVETAPEETVYEVIADPQEPPEQAQQEEVRENLAQGPAHPSTEQQPEVKPRCITPILNFI